MNYNKCYLTTNDYDGKGPRLIGVVTRLGFNNYTFKYEYSNGLPGTPLLFQIGALKDLTKLYDTRDVVNEVFKFFFSPPTHFRYKHQCKLFNLPEDSEMWEFFEKAYKQAEEWNTRGIPFVMTNDGNYRLYTQLPGNVVIC